MTKIDSFPGKGLSAEEIAIRVAIMHSLIGTDVDEEFPEGVMSMKSFKVSYTLILFTPTLISN